LNWFSLISIHFLAIFIVFFVVGAGQARSLPKGPGPDWAVTDDRRPLLELLSTCLGLGPPFSEIRSHQGARIYDQIWPNMARIRSHQGARIILIYGPYMFIYVPYMTKYGQYMVIYSPYMVIYGP
jgi:hypothetical protein